MICTCHGAGSLSLRAIHFITIPAIGPFNGPVDRLIGVAPVAGVWNTDFLCEQRIGNQEAVIAPRIALHVGGLRHVTFDAAIARAHILVVAMFERINNRRVHQARGLVASHA